MRDFILDMLFDFKNNEFDAGMTKIQAKSPVTLGLSLARTLTHKPQNW